MAQGMLELACELARQVLRHELSVNPNALQPVIREALGPAGGRHQECRGAACTRWIWTCSRRSCGPSFPAMSLTLLADADA